MTNQLLSTGWVLLISTVLICLGCTTDRYTADHPSPKDNTVPAKKPVAKTPTFVQDPAYANLGGRHQLTFAASFDFDQPVALPQDPDADPPAKAVEASRMKKAPLVLDIRCTSQEFGPGPLAKVVNVQAFTPGGQRVGEFVIPRDAEYGMQRRVFVASDRGAYSELIEHQRMAFPVDLVELLRDRPSTEVTIVGFDAEGRTMLVATANGFHADGGVFVGPALVSFKVNKLYEVQSGTLHAGFRPTYFIDEPVAKTLDLGLGAKIHPAPPVPPRFAKSEPLVIELFGYTPTSLTVSRPLSQVVTLYIFDNSSHLLAARSVAKDCHFGSGEVDLEEDIGRINYNAEFLRTALSVELAAEARKDRFPSIAMVGVDAQGRTVISEIMTLPPKP